MRKTIIKDLVEARKARSRRKAQPRLRRSASRNLYLEGYRRGLNEGVDIGIEAAFAEIRAFYTKERGR